MSEPSITKDSYNVLCIIYKTYLQLRKTGISKTEAKYFSDYTLFGREYCSQYDESEFYEYIVELKQNNFIKVFVDGGFELTNEAIILMENRFKNGISDVMEFIKKLPFI